MPVKNDGLAIGSHALAGFDIEHVEVLFRTDDECNVKSSIKCSTLKDFSAFCPGIKAQVSEYSTGLYETNVTKIEFCISWLGEARTISTINSDRIATFRDKSKFVITKSSEVEPILDKIINAPWLIDK